MADPSKNTGILLALMSLGMLGLAYASVPLYRIFCQKTGFGGTPQIAKSLPTHMEEREITVRFNADTSLGLPWEFYPLQKEVTVKVGQVGLAFYHAKNLSNAGTVGMATYNVTPDKMGIYFNKVECFCFIQQHLEPGQEADFPVQFFIDPDMINDQDVDDVKTITLSYTFFKQRQ